MHPAIMMVLPIIGFACGLVIKTLQDIGYIRQFTEAEINFAVWWIITPMVIISIVFFILNQLGRNEITRQH